ncbi:putative L-ascorbate peroxidase 6 [Tanacetum coccineum]
MADTIVMARSEAVSLCGGPTIPIRLGRLELVVPDPEGKLPEETTQELVALSGAHTLGSKGFGNPVVFDNAYYKVLLEKPWQSSEEHVCLEAALKKEFEDQQNENRREWQEKFKELQSWKITTPLPT